MFNNLQDNGIDIKKILIIIAGIFLVVIALITYFSKNNQFKDFIIVSESLIIGKRDGKWQQIKKIDENILKKRYTVVGDFGIKKNVHLKYNEDTNEFYYLDKNYSDLDIQFPLAAYTSRFNRVKTCQYDISDYESSDDAILKKVLPDKNISDFSDSLFKSSYDLDGDGKLEVIYTMNNTSLEQRNALFSTIFLVSGGKYVGKIDKDDSKVYMVRSIIDLDGDGKYEVVVSKGDIDHSSFDSNYQIYSYKRGKMIKIMG